MISQTLSIRLRVHVAGSLDTADDGILVRDYGNVVNLDVTCLELLLNVEACDIYGDVVRKVVQESAYANAAPVLEELTTLLYTYSVSCDYERNLDSDRLGLVNCEEVYVEADVCNRVPLELVKNCCKLLGSVKNEVNDVRCRSVCESLELLCVNCEKYVLYTATVEVARYETFCAKSLDGCLVASLTCLAIKFKMLHF